MIENFICFCTKKGYRMNCPIHGKHDEKETVHITIGGWTIIIGAFTLGFWLCLWMIPS